MIQQLNGGAALTWPAQKLRYLIDSLLRGIPYLGYRFEHGSLKVFRGRIGDSHNFFSAPSDFSYVPHNEVKSAGRCHSVGNSIFYGSLNLDTVLSELTPEIGDRVYVGVATVKISQLLTLSCIGELDYSRRYDKALIGDQNGFLQLQNLLKSMPPEEHIRNLLVDAFFADIFSKPAYKSRDYKVTNALSDLLLESKVLDGFFYPSVAHRGGLNVAIIPERFDGIMKWEHFMAFEINDFMGYGLYGRQQLASATEVVDGVIKWESLV